MSGSYYTSLCRAWIDHEIINIPSEKERLVEICTDERSLERVSEWVIDKIQDADNGNSTVRCLQDCIDKIDFIIIAKGICEEYAVCL